MKTTPSIVLMAILTVTLIPVAFISRASPSVHTHDYTRSEQQGNNCNCHLSSHTAQEAKTLGRWNLKQPGRPGSTLRSISRSFRADLPDAAKLASPGDMPAC